MGINNVILIGRLTKDPDFRVGQSTQVARFTLAVSRGKKDGKDLGADFPQVVCFGKTADLVDKYLKKGKQIGVVGKIQTNTYEKDGKKVYTTEVLCDRIEFLDTDYGKQPEATSLTEEPSADDNPQIGFSKFEDDDIPF